VKKKPPTDEQEAARAAAEIARQQLQAVARELAIRDAQDGLIPFQKYMMPDPNRPDDATASLYRDAEVHRVIAQSLERVARGECLRMLLSVPPQHGKSQLCSRGFPAWCAGKWPHKNIMLGTYNQDFANEFGDDVRNLIEHPRYNDVFAGARLRTGSRAKDHMVTVGGGKLSFLGRGGAGTGRPADLFIIDDPIKNSIEASSLVIRNEVWEWFTKVAFTRCHALSAIIVIQTRWDEDDLIGRITDPRNPFYNPEESAKWTYINLPAIFDDPRDFELADAMGVPRGGVLWPERFTVEHFASARRLNPRGFSALYQGRPTPAEGAFFKEDHLFGYTLDEMPPLERLTPYGSGDLAVSTENSADRSCIGNWGMDEYGTLWLLPELYWERKAADESVETMLDFQRRYGWLSYFSEKGVIDRAIKPFLNKRMQETGDYISISTYPRTASKAAMSVSIRGRMAQGKVRFPTFAPWWQAAKDQILRFTGEGDQEDDFVDMLAGIGIGLAKQISGSKAPAQAEKEPPVGSWAWLKRLDKHKKQRAAAHRAVSGM
jgi:predicted phage terminase large subunit-like protein